MPDETINKNPESHHSTGLFHSFCEFPHGIKFQNQEEDEYIMLFLRRHFITNVPWITIFVLLFILPFFILPIFSQIQFLPIDLPSNFSLVVLLFYYLGIFGYGVINFLQWFYNIGIVTQKNVIDIDYTNIVNVNVAATKVTQIEDVTYNQSGFFKTLFNYGDIFIQTAGHLQNFEFLSVPKPDKVADLVHDTIGKKKH